MRQIMPCNTISLIFQSIKKLSPLIFLYCLNVNSLPPSQPSHIVLPTPQQETPQVLEEKMPHLTISIVNTNNPSQGNISNTNNSSVQADLEQASHQRTQQSVTQTTEIRNRQILITRIDSFSSSIPFDYYKKKASDAYSTSTQWVTDYRYHLLFAAGVISYLTLYYVAHNGFNYFRKPSLWSSWKPEYPLEQLFSLPQEAVTQELIVAIQTRYMSCENPTDCIQPLVYFVKDIDHEIKNLRWYKTYFTWLDRLYLSRITFTRPDYATEIERRLERLSYIKHTFGQWIAQQNLMYAFDQPPSRSLYQQITNSVKMAFHFSTEKIYRGYVSLLQNIQTTTQGKF